MAKIKVDAEGVDTSGGDFTPVKPGLYRAKIEEINHRPDQKYGDDIEVIMTVTADSKGKKKDVEGIGSKLWTYIYLDHEPTAFRLAEFLDAVGAKRKGVLDTAKFIGAEVQVRVKPDQNLEGEYRPRVGKILALDAEAEPEEGEPEPEEPEAEAEPEEEAIDLDALDRDELKKFIRDQELGTLADLGITKATTDEQIRDLIAEKMSEGAEEPEPEPEEEPEPEPEEEPEAEPEPEDDGLDDLDREALKKLIREEELGTLADLGINKASTDDEIREIIRGARGGGNADTEQDYSSFGKEQLLAELKARGIEDAPKSLQAMRNRLKKDDKDDTEPF